jgi:hypothetical protein
LPATAIAFIGDIPASFNILRNIGSGILSVGNNTLELDAFAFFGGMAVSTVDDLPGVVAKVEGTFSISLNVRRSDLYRFELSSAVTKSWIHKESILQKKDTRQTKDINYEQQRVHVRTSESKTGYGKDSERSQDGRGNKGDQRKRSTY